MYADSAAASQPEAQQTRKRSAADLDGDAGPHADASAAAAAAAAAQHADPAEVPLDSDDSAAIVEESDASEGVEVTGRQRDPAVVLDETLQALLERLAAPHHRCGSSCLMLLQAHKQCCLQQVLETHRIGAAPMLTWSHMA